MQSHRAEEVADAPCVELQVDGVNDEVAQERVEQDADGFTTRFTTGFTLLTSFYLVLPLVLPCFTSFYHWFYLVFARFRMFWLRLSGSGPWTPLLLAPEKQERHVNVAAFSGWLSQMQVTRPEMLRAVPAWVWRQDMQSKT